MIDLIRKKRDGGALSAAEIGYLVDAYTQGTVPDYQVAAWLMAVVLRGMTREETAGLTHSMLHSGEVLDLTFLPAKKVDKHSTGGVGDKTSLVLAPVVATGGLYVPMISGRGLGGNRLTLSMPILCSKFLQDIKPVPANQTDGINIVLQLQMIPRKVSVTPSVQVFGKWVRVLDWCVISRDGIPTSVT